MELFYCITCSRMQLVRFLFQGRGLSRLPRRCKRNRYVTGWIRGFLLVRRISKWFKPRPIPRFNSILLFKYIFRKLFKKFNYKFTLKFEFFFHRNGFHPYFHWQWAVKSAGRIYKGLWRSSLSTLDGRMDEALLHPIWSIVKCQLNLKVMLISLWGRQNCLCSAPILKGFCTSGVG